MKLSVLIPSYLRVNDLRRNLDALKRQTRLPDQVVVAVRASDTVINDFVKEYDFTPLSATIATAPEVGGFSGAINAGLKEVTGDAVAVTDDDTEADADWLERIENFFLSDPLIGGVGGRDIQPGKLEATEPVVGIVRWWGNVIGNHHLGLGGPREVDILKGCNCAYRTAPFQAIGFDKRLLGKGMQMNTEVVLGLAFRRAGWKLIYDPAVALMHYPGERFDIDKRNIEFNAEANFNQAHNRALAVYEHFSPVQRLVFVLWAVLVGTRADPGLVQIFRMATRDKYVVRKAVISFRGLIAGIQTARKTTRPETISPSVVAAQTATSSSAPLVSEKVESVG